MVNKRKRDDPSDSDSDEITPGKQILPVANLPADFDGEPQDGMQYLFLVRRDARRLPHVTRARNPYEVPESQVAPTFTSSSSDVLPYQGWRDAFQRHFVNLRRNLIQSTTHVDRDHPESRRKAVPEKKDRDAWWKFLAGYPESAWSPETRSVRRKRGLGASFSAQASTGPVGNVQPEDVTTVPNAQSGKPHYLPNNDSPRNVTPQRSCLGRVQTGHSASSTPHVVNPSMSSEIGGEHLEPLSPPEVTPNHLREIDHRMSIHLLMYFTHWINTHLQNPNDPLTTITVIHGQWIFALLARIEDQLSADEMNILRNLARGCLRLIERRNTKHDKNRAVLEETSVTPLVKNTSKMSDAACWMIFAAIAGYWGQKDLWGNAETVLIACGT